MGKRKERRPKAEKKPKAERKPKRVSPKASSGSSSGLGKAILAIIIILIDVIIFITVHQNKFNIDKEDKIVEASTAQIRRETAERKLASLPQLTDQINEISSKLKPQMENYFGDYLQENIILYLNELQNESEVTMSTIVFLPPIILEDTSSTSQVPDEEEEGSEEEVEDDESQTEDIPASEEDAGWNMVVNTMVVNLSVYGTYKDFMKFLSLIDENEKKVSVSSIDLTPVLSFITVGDDQETEIEAEQEIMASVSLIFYSIPSVEKYLDIEDLYTWEYDLSVKNPFDENNLMDKVHNKFVVYEFANGNQNIDVRNTDQSNISFEKQNDTDGISVVSLKYNFGENDENPMILIDLKSENISVDKADKIGIEMHSDGSNKGRIHLILSDSNNNEVALEITDEIYWKGWVNLDGRINQAMAFPIRVTGVMVSQQGKGEELESGSLKFKKIFSATKVQDEETEDGNVVDE